MVTANSAEVVPPSGAGASGNANKLCEQIPRAMSTTSNNDFFIMFLV